MKLNKKNLSSSEANGYWPARQWLVHMDTTGIHLECENPHLENHILESDGLKKIYSQVSKLRESLKQSNQFKPEQWLCLL